MKQPVVFCWSGGKDSALALHRLQHDARYEIIGLLTTCNAHFQRVSMHGVRTELVDAQARALSLPMQKVFVSEHSSNEEYSQRMTECLRSFRELGVRHCAYGDIFLADLRAWREQQLAQLDMVGLFPLWQNDTRKLLHEFVAQGFGAVTCCVNDAWLEEQWVGRYLDARFASSLPKSVDPCGENGEFHSFVFAAPNFSAPIPFTLGEKVYRSLDEPIDPASRTRGFWYCDLLSA